jgi:hypothetical protein
MFDRKQIQPLSDYKRSLLLESELNRLSFRAELAQLRTAAALLDEVPIRIRRMGPWLYMLAPVAGLVSTLLRSRRSTPRRGDHSVLEWIPLALAVWRRLRQGRKTASQGRSDPPQ